MYSDRQIYHVRHPPFACPYSKAFLPLDTPFGCPKPRLPKPNFVRSRAIYIRLTSRFLHLHGSSKLSFRFARRFWVPRSPGSPAGISGCSRPLFGGKPGYPPFGPVRGWLAGVGPFSHVLGSLELKQEPNVAIKSPEISVS